MACDFSDNASQGVKTSGKVAYLTSLLPYLLLLLLAGRALTLPGAGAGLLYLASPDWSRLGHVSLWVDAATQVGERSSNLCTLDITRLSSPWAQLVAASSPWPRTTGLCVRRTQKQLSS